MRYMPQLDSVRAFAILAVMFEHFAGRGINERLPISAGSLGVSLFFAMSGFLITGILIASFDRPGPRIDKWKTFYLRRFLRLAPALYAVILLLCLFGVTVVRQSWAWHAFYLSNVYIAFGGAKLIFWTLAVEEQFYMVWPFVIAFSPRRHLKAICVGLFLSGIAWKLMALGIGMPRQTANVMLPGAFEALGAGCLVAALSYRGGKTNQFDWLTPALNRRFGAVAIASLGLAAGIGLSLGRSGLVAYLFVPALLAILYGWIVANAGRGVEGVLKPVLENGVLRWIGQISYGLYLVHNWVPELVERVAGPLPKIVAAPMVLAITFAICALSFRYFEAPIRNFAHRKPRGVAAMERSAAS